MREQLEVNALGPLRTVAGAAPEPRPGGKVALITSRMGSIGDNGSGGYYGYRMSKAALNAAGMSLARDLAPRRIAVAILHPGYVRTDMTGKHGNGRSRRGGEAAGRAHRRADARDDRHVLARERPGAALVEGGIEYEYECEYEQDAPAWILVVLVLVLVSSYAGVKNLPWTQPC